MTTSQHLCSLMQVIHVKPRERERLTSSLFSPVNVTVYTRDAVQTVFVDLFCSPKSSMECKDNTSQVHFRSVNLYKEFAYRSEIE